MNADRDLLFRPLELGGYTLPNRLVMAPMTRCFSPRGVPGPDVAAYYRRRVEGGLGLIITEGTWIDHPAASNEENAPRFYGEDALAGWAEVARQVHAAGGRIMPQLWHVGLSRRPAADYIYEEIVEDLSGKVSPSGYVMPGEKVGEPMSTATAEAIIAAYAKAARSAEALGFDGVELHGAHGYLIDQFLWSETNRRTDRFGGDIGERTRFGVEVVQAIRAVVAEDFPVVFRFSQWKLQDYAARMVGTPHELERLLTPLVEAGVDVFHASQRRYWLPEFEGSPLNLAGWAKKITGKPAITVGSVGLAREMNDSIVNGGETPVERIESLLEMLARGDFDLVAVGRAVLADPDWPHKVRRGEIESILPFRPEVMATLR
jgi:2,4-dienoyl-CoA reductase-like NADH-dependent reductase (Old Yellow Enzyme family)